MGFQQLEYDVDRVRLNVGGFAVSRGAGASGYPEDGPFVKIAQNGPSFVFKRGIDGTVTRSKTNNHVAEMSVFTMSSNSPTNGFFSGLIAADEAGPNGVSIVSFVMEDLQGTSIFISDAAWLVQRPDWSGEQTAVPLEWKFNSIWRLWVVGGN